MVKSVLLSYFSQFLALTTQIFSIRLLLDYFGLAGFSSISFLLGVIAIVGIFEIGISQTLMRSNAAKDQNTIFINNLAYIYFIFISVVVVIAFFINRLFISEIHADNYAFLFLIIFLAKVFGIFYKSISFGLGKYDQINILNLLISLLRNIVLPLACIFFELTLTYYMAIYFLMCLIELLYFIHLSKFRFRKKDLVFVNFSYIKRDLKLFFQIAIIGFTWTYSQNIERMIVMYFSIEMDLIVITLALTVMSSMFYVNTAITNIFNVKLISSLSEKEEKFKKIFLSLSKFRMFVFSLMTITLYAFTEQILFMWLNDYPDIKTLSHILKILIIGVFFILVSSVSFQYQFVKGKIDIQLKAAVVYIFIQTILGAYLYSSIGLAGMSLSFLVLNSIFSILLICYVFLKNELKVLAYLLGCILISGVVFLILTQFTSLMATSAIVIISSAILLIVLEPLKEIKNVN